MAEVNGVFTLPSLPYLTSALPAVGGVIRAEPEDFRVAELPAYPASGEGAHLYVTIEKRLRTTEDVAVALARAAGVPRPEVGYAGQKDRDAVTVQRFSLPAAAQGFDTRFALEGARVLEVSRHTNRLKTGHLAGNRFEIVISGVGSDALERARQIGESISSSGVLNAFGPQRFGHNGQTAQDGLRLVRDPKNAPGARDRFRRKLFVSAAQALLFNDYLARRAADGFLHRVLDGDVVKKTETGGMFVVEDVLEAQARYDARAIIPQGPIFGRKTFASAREAARRESEVLLGYELSVHSFDPFGKLAMGTRRPILVFPEGLEIRPHERGVEVCFALPAGAFATMVLREFVREEVR